MAAPNLQTPTTITGKLAVQACTNSATAIVSNSAASGKLLRVDSLIIGNTTSGPVTVTVDVYRSSTAYRICTTLPVPANATIVPILKDAPVNLEEGDSLRITAGATSSLEAVASYSEVS